MLDGGAELENCLGLVRERAVGVEGGEWFVRGGALVVGEWAWVDRRPTSHKSLPLLSRDRGAAAVDARGGVVERAEVSKWHIGEYLRRHPLS